MVQVGGMRCESELYAQVSMVVFWDVTRRDKYPSEAEMRRRYCLNEALDRAKAMIVICELEEGDVFRSSFHVLSLHRFS